VKGHKKSSLHNCEVSLAPAVDESEALRPEGNSRIDARDTEK
jgi:hypothetical protein